jgi:hypothetical protein
MPYFSYFKLIKLVDRFIILDDVNFIKKGWINRNQILINNKAYLFTLPISSSSQNKKINELNLSTEITWKKNFLKTIKQGYAKSPQFHNFFPLLEEIISFNDLNLSSFIGNSLMSVCNYLNIETEIIRTSSVFCNQDLTGESRIMDICKKNRCTEYINLPGGRSLYHSNLFSSSNIKLHFLKENEVTYKQFQGECIKNLSMIDYLMFNSPANFNDHCNIN